jgi:hypothetical protein
MPRSALKIPTVAGPVSWSRATGPRRTQSSEHQRIPPRCPSPFGWKLWIVAGLILQVAAGSDSLSAGEVEIRKRAGDGDED